MNDTNAIVALIALGACLVLALRGMRGRNLHRNRILMMGVVWAVAIAALSYALRYFT